MEIEVSLTVVIVELMALRWIVNRLPILSDPPMWKRVHTKEAFKKIFLVKETEDVSENNRGMEEWKVSSM
jgi:hypothetical protein